MMVTHPTADQGQGSLTFLMKAETLPHYQKRFYDKRTFCKNPLPTISCCILVLKHTFQLFSFKF